MIVQSTSEKNKTLEDWTEYANSAWHAAGRPPGLEPDMVVNAPREYDHNYYQYFERRYIDLWSAIHARINPINGTLLKKESAAFREAWERNYSWQSIWKQILPLLVYGSAFGARHGVIIEVASLYCIGQAIPSIVIDRMLDEKSNFTEADSAFCVLAYSKALRGLTAMNLPCGAALVDTYLNLTGYMYDKMLSEHRHRFASIPAQGFLTDVVPNYLLPGDRIMSSVYFGILPVWAQTLANKPASKELIKSTEALRKVRQLNDEIVDVFDDIKEGLLTLPWLYALEEVPDLRWEIERLWANNKDSTALAKCKDIMSNSSARQRVAAKSLGILSESMKMTQKMFNSNTAFELTLLHNVRWALLNWIEEVRYDRDPNTIREPLDPQELILDSSNPIEPVPGGGVIVHGESQKVLLTLVLKRGMLRWELPAGVAKDGESMEEAAQREALEETGEKIEIGDVAAMCWHHSRKLNKGWMGVIFEGKLANESIQEEFVVARPEAFSHTKFNIHLNSDLYSSVVLKEYDFDNLVQLCEKHNEIAPAHESVVASGFVDWQKIPAGRIHPLHLKLLESTVRNNQGVELLVANADEDIEHYNSGDKLYYKN